MSPITQPLVHYIHATVQLSPYTLHCAAPFPLQKIAPSSSHGRIWTHHSLEPPDQPQTQLVTAVIFAQYMVVIDRGRDRPTEQTRKSTHTKGRLHYILYSGAA